MEVLRKKYKDGILLVNQVLCACGPSARGAMLGELVFCVFVCCVVLKPDTGRGDWCIHSRQLCQWCVITFIRVHNEANLK